VATSTSSTRPSRGRLRAPNALGNGHLNQPAGMAPHGGRGPHTRVLRSPAAQATRGRLGTASIQKPPTGNFYCAGEFCPQVDAGKTTQNSAGRTLTGQYDNGLRWKYT
jgi:hypothetical protein